MANGIVIIDKPAGWTSMDVCAKLRGVFREKRVGHGGTLDPMATGVLPVFVGRATRAVEFADGFEKEYLAGLTLGVSTNTQDVTGEVLERRAVNVTPEDLERALAPFRGDILQIPPMFSAVKIGGKKLYELARKGREVERQPRPVTVHSLEVVERTGENDYLLNLVCSKGTYVRTICHDVGQALGCGGAMSSLRRKRSAGFSLADAVTLEQVLAAADPTVFLRPVDGMFAYLPAVTLPPRAEKLLRNGVDVPLPDGAAGECRVYGADGAFLALCKAQGDRLHTVKSFFAPPRNA